MAGYTLKLDLSSHEHDELVKWLKQGSHNPAIKKILYEIVGYDEAVEEAKKYARMEELSGHLAADCRRESGVR